MNPKTQEGIAYTRTIAIRLAKSGFALVSIRDIGGEAVGNAIEDVGTTPAERLYFRKSSPRGFTYGAILAVYENGNPEAIVDWHTRHANEPFSEVMEKLTSSQGG